MAEDHEHELKAEVERIMVDPATTLEQKRALALQAATAYFVRAVHAGTKANDTGKLFRALALVVARETEKKEPTE